MSDLEPDRDQEPERESMHLDDDEVRSLLRKAMRVEPRTTASVLPEVQRKIRQRSRGKFFADGWSTASSPSSTYIVTSIVMLVVLAIIYWALVPGGWGTP